MARALFFVASLLVCSFAHADEAKRITLNLPGADPEKAEQIAQYMNTSGLGDALDGITDLLLQKTAEKLKLSKKDTADLRKKVAFSAEEKKFAMEKIARLLDDNYTTAELNAYNAFASSPDGKAFLKKQNKLDGNIKSIIMAEFAPKVGALTQAVLENDVIGKD